MICRFVVVVAPVIMVCPFALNQHAALKARRSIAPAKHAGNGGEERLRVVDFVKDLNGERKEQRKRTPRVAWRASNTLYLPT